MVWYVYFKKDTNLVVHQDVKNNIFLKQHLFF